jgi:hypothetical protein
VVSIEKQSLLGRSCVNTVELAPADPGDYTGIQGTVHYSAVGKLTKNRLNVKYLPWVTGSSGSPVIKASTVSPGVTFSGLTFEASAVLGPDTVFPGIIASHGSWSKRHVSQLKLHHDGAALVISGRLPAICGSCSRVVELSTDNVGDDGQLLPPLARGRFHARKGFVNFRLRVSAGDIERKGNLLELQAPVTVSRGPSPDARKDVVKSTDLQLLVEHRGSGLRAQAVYPWTANHVQTFDVGAERPVAYILSLSGFSTGYSGGSSCCQQLKLTPDYRNLNGVPTVTLRWPRLLLPGQGQRETITAIYADGHEEQLLSETVQRRAR